MTMMASRNRKRRRGKAAIIRIGDKNFYEMKTSKLAMPRLVTVPACFGDVKGDEGLFLLLWAQADDAQ